MNTFNSTANQIGRNLATFNEPVDQVQPNLDNGGGSGSEETGLLRRYVTSPALSENTNSLINRKRELILNSKKYNFFFLNYFFLYYSHSSAYSVLEHQNIDYYKFVCFFL